jgi:hypothetical protein
MAAVRAAPKVNKPTTAVTQIPASLLLGGRTSMMKPSGAVTVVALVTCTGLSDGDVTMEGVGLGDGTGAVT